MARLVKVHAQREPDGGGSYDYIIDLDRLVYAFDGRNSSGKEYRGLALEGPERGFFLFDKDRERMNAYLESRLTNSEA